MSLKMVWGYSSAGRAPALQAGGRRFDPDYLHQVNSQNVQTSEQSPAKRVCEEEETQRNERDVLLAVRRVIWSLCRRGPVAQLARAYD